MRALLVAVVALIVVIGIGLGVISATSAFLIAALLTISIPVALVGGLVRLIRESGVTLQAVAGSLTIYLLVGLLFAFTIGFVSRVETGSYFKQAGSVPTGVRVYYSFTVLTTTGFGDYTPAQPAGHAIAVLEMLIGQLYLVTVIGVVVGNLGRRRERVRPGSSDRGDD